MSDVTQTEALCFVPVKVLSSVRSLNRKETSMACAETIDPAMRRLNELHLINFINALLVGLAVSLPHSSLRVPLGLLSTLFFPGYTLIAALYPRREDLSGAERIALSLGSSLAIVSLIGLGLNFVPWGIRLGPILISLASFTAICSLLAAEARRRLPPAERFAIEIGFLFGQLHTLSWGQAAVAGVVITALALVGWGLHAASSRTEETFTEFYVLNGLEKAAAYPEWIPAGKSADIILGIINRELRRAKYTIMIQAGNQVVTTLGPLTLDAGQKWERNVQVSLAKPGTHQEIAFLLYKDGDPVPYRRLHLWVNVGRP